KKKEREIKSKKKRRGNQDQRKRKVVGMQNGWSLLNLFHTSSTNKVMEAMIRGRIFSRKGGMI
ncbi:unnamed protein product, partial [Musa textilis]